MQFTDAEAKLIARLRKQERQWRWIRWGVLLAGIIMVVDLVLFGSMLLSLVNRISEAPSPQLDDVFAFSLFWPKVLIYLAIGTWCFAIAFRDWNGNANRMLLLKLLDELQKKPDSE